MIIIQENDFMKARTLIRKSIEKQIVFCSDDDDLNRKILEKEKINVLLLNVKEKKDKIKQRDSGFNHVLAREAKKKNVEIGINLDEIINSNKKEKTGILARIRQNIELCNKYKLNMKFISPSENERDIYDLKALGLVLGMPTWMTKSL
ncbi:hypothetical protein HYT24_03305 [Candidatus Pacearchaeota archaeon]|nr:hypothetical protein [Candidatus Pacearchaeota archaeon]